MVLGGLVNVFIGLALVFGSVALLASTVTEGIASALKIRSTTLLAGLKTILNVEPPSGARQFLPPLTAIIPNSASGYNAKLLNDLLNHAVINPRGPGNNAQLSEARSVRPSYILPAHFAIALLDVIQTAPDGTRPNLGAAISQVKDQQLRQFLQGAYERVNGDAAKLRDEIAQWFDSAMNRVSGDYKRYSQFWSFVIAMSLAILLNIDAVDITRAALTTPALVENVQVTISDNNGLSNLLLAQKDGLPIGWRISDDWTPIDSLWTAFWNKPLHSMLIGLSKLLGWSITAVAALFGAPFWFDTLQRFISLRGTGAKPDKPTPA